MISHPDDSTSTPYRYAQVNTCKLNVRQQPQQDAARWNYIWPMNRIALVRDYNDQWVQSTYRGKAAYVMKEFMTPLSIPVSKKIVERMPCIMQPEIGRKDSRCFNGYTGKWCHRFADWLTLSAGMPLRFIPNTSNCGIGISWFLMSEESGGFHFVSEAHRERFLRKYTRIKGQAQPVLETYQPQAGDYIYLRWKTSFESVAVSHVGIIGKAYDNWVTAWEGNAGSKRAVMEREYDLLDTQIVGYGSPRYDLAYPDMHIQKSHEDPSSNVAAV